MSIESLSGNVYQPQTQQSGTSTPLGNGSGNDLSKPPVTTAVSTADTVSISAEASALLEAEENAPLQPLGSGNGNDPPAQTMGSGSGNDYPVKT